MKKKETIRAIIFLILLIGVIQYVGNVFSFPAGYIGDGVKERFDSFYDQPENTIDGVYIGSSGVDRYWVGPQAYHDYGETVFALSSGTQPLVFAKYLIKETLKLHDAKVFIIDVRSAVKGSDQVNDVFIRRVTDNMHFSLNRLQATKAALEFSALGDNTVDEKDWSYYFNLLKYHWEWDGDVTVQEFLEPDPVLDYMGYAAHTDVIYNVQKFSIPKITNLRASIPKETEDVLKDLLDYCDTLEDVDFLFVASPYSIGDKVQRKVNYAMDIIKSRGYNTINFNSVQMYNAVGLDFDTDYYDTHHVNLVGALKYTDYLAKYLRSKYDLPDRRNDKAYVGWEKAYKTLTEATQEGAAVLTKKIAKSTAHK
jgi:hypothetical protein